MRSSLGWGIIGAGIIAHKFADAVSHVDHTHIVAVASKDPQKAVNFADQYGVLASPNYLELVRRSDVEAIYVATTHNFHYENAKLALKNGKHVLVEKPFTVNAEQAQSLIDLAVENDCFLMEGIWVRFLPTMIKLKEMIKAGVIGDIKAINVSFGGFAPDHYRPRLIDPMLAGGVTLDMGIYPLTFIHFVLDALPVKHASFARMSDTGVDEVASYLLRFDNDCLASVLTSYNLMTRFEAMIYGSLGYIEFPKFQEGQEFHVYHHNGTREIDRCETVRCQHHENGFVYQVREVVKQIHNKKLESPVIPLQESLQTMRLMDQMRAAWGFRYPFEKDE